MFLANKYLGDETTLSGRQQEGIVKGIRNSDLVGLTAETEAG